MARRRTALLGLLLLLAGCDLAGKPGPATRWTLSGEGENNPGLPGEIAPKPEVVGSGVGDPVAANPYAVRVDIWAIVVPRGSVSANEPFWKRVDEGAISPDKYELLFANGFRVGVARQEDWDYFKDLLSRHPARSQLNAITVTEEQTVEVPVRRGIDSEQLTYLAPGKPVEGHMHFESDNIIQLGFVPAPRRTDAARIAITPMVRSTKERLEVAPNGDEKVLKYTVPTRIYELNLAVEVPFGRFMVCSPSTDTAISTSIGRNFLMMDGEVEQSEIVLLIVPTKVPIKEKTEAKTGVAGKDFGTTDEHR